MGLTIEDNGEEFIGMTFSDRALLIAGGYGNPSGVIIRIGEIQRSSELLLELRAVVLSCWTRCGEGLSVN